MDFSTALAYLADDPDCPFAVEELALLVATDEYPDLPLRRCLRRLDELADRVRPHVRGSLAERAAALGEGLFGVGGFRGNGGDYYDPRNSYLNDVLDRKLGIPITLSVLATAVGHRVGLRVVGVGLPGHFVAKALGDDGAEAVFDPFHGGKLLTASDCEALVERSTGIPFEATPEALAGTTPRGVVARMLTNLKGVYVRAGDWARVARVVERMRQLEPAEPVHHRDLGAALVQAGRYGSAIDHLEAYLAAAPDANDRDAVADVLRRARAEVARWN